MLCFPLKKEWFEKIKKGEKTIEYRETTKYWQRRLMNAEYSSGCVSWGSTQKCYRFESYTAPCCFRLGYTGEILQAWITKIEVVDGNDTDLHVAKPVYAIHFKLIEE